MLFRRALAPARRLPNSTCVIKMLQNNTLPREDLLVKAGDARPRKCLISIVCPVYNEELNVLDFYNTVVGALAPETDKYDFEFIFTDNHSEDQTFDILQGLVIRDPRVRVFRFSRNFGYQKSIYTAYMKAKGDAAVQLDCDLQDPPAMVREFLRSWEEGYSVVYGIRRSRQEGPVITGLRKIFYRLINSISETPLPEDAGDFRLIDRRIIEELRSIHDNKIYIRGRIAGMGFRQLGISYDRAKRNRGESKFRFRHNMALAVDAITAHSALPLRIATYFGAFVTALTGLGIISYLIAYLASANSWPSGFATIVLLLLFMLGTVSLFLGIIGEYVARIYEHMKASPKVIIEESIEQSSAIRNTDAR
jgi:polyisoprenyl-phosphate glycosyltransferase